MNKITVKSHDGTTQEFDSREAAVEFIKEHLAQWMNPTDRISWGFLHATDKPDAAQVLTEHGEPCDAYTLIL